MFTKKKLKLDNQKKKFEKCEKGENCKKSEKR